jgi:uncharacterized membrane protein
VKHVALEKGRLEAFSDGVIAVIITIMVLELRVPHGSDPAALRSVGPTFIAYVISFANVGIYWNNHHHLLRAAGGIDGRVMWANLHLLFWLSLIPFVTAWVGQNPAASLPTAVYSVVLFCSGTAFTLLSLALIAANGTGSTIARAVGSNRKGIVSLLCYALAIGFAFVAPWMSDVFVVAVALMWFVPDRRVERALVKEERAEDAPALPNESLLGG